MSTIVPVYDNVTVSADTSKIYLAEGYPFVMNFVGNNNGTIVYIKHNQTGGTKGVQIYGRLHTSAPWVSLVNITNNTSQGYVSGITSCPYYKVAINTTGTSMTADVALITRAGSLKEI
jgi:hypothetical protein